MPRVAPLQASFSSGEVSALVYGRADAPRYRTALGTCLNYIPTVQGPLIRRPGTAFVAATKDSGKKSRLQAFNFSTTDAFILEFGHNYVRFYKNNGQILLTGNPYEVSTTYTEDEVFDLSFVQTADVLYILHPLHAPAKLIRTTDTNWTLSNITFLDGPYFPQNTTSTTLSPNNVSGSVTLTASGTTGINNNQGFLTTDVGRLVRIKHTNWSYGVITSYFSSTQVIMTILGPAMVVSAVTTWRLGLWSSTTGYPACGCFHEDRLCLAGGNTAYPQRSDLSNTGDYENFAPSAADGTVTDTNALAFNLRSNDVNSIYWAVSDEKGLLHGTSAGEWAIRSSGGYLSPSDASAKQVTSYGSAKVTPVQVGKSTMFLQAGGRKVREMGYDFDVAGFRSPDRTILSSHITGSEGVKQLAYSKAPHSVLWAVRNDGILSSMTYDNDDNNLIIGWARHKMGNFSEGMAGTTDMAMVESVAVIPSPDGTREEAWVIVNRMGGNPFGPDGGNNRYVEYITKYFEEGDDQRDAFFVDSGLVYDDPRVVTNLTYVGSGPYTVTVEVIAHGYSNGDTVLFSNLGFNNPALDEQKFLISNTTTDTFDISTSIGGAFVYNGVCRKCVSTVSGLSHLEGNTVDILADGAAVTPQVVLSGSVTIPGSIKASRIQVGLNIEADGQLLRLEAGAADGTSFGKSRRTNRVGFMVHNTLGLKIGVDFNSMDEVVFRSAADNTGEAVPLFSGIVSEAISADNDFENQIAWRQDQPFPGTIQAVMPQMETQDRS